MTKLNTKLTGILALVFAVAIAPASLAFAQTSVDAETSANASFSANSVDVEVKKANIKAKVAAIKENNQERSDELKRKVRDMVIQRTDRITDELRPVIRDVSDVDRRPDLTFRGQTDGWAIVGGVAHKSTLALAGDAHHLGGGNWKIDTEGKFQVGDRNAKLDLSGFARGNVIYLQGSGSLDNGESFRMTLRGHFAPTGEDNVYAVAFTHAGIHYTNSGLRVPLMLVGSVTVVDTTPTPIPLPAEQQ